MTLIARPLALIEPAVADALNRPSLQVNLLGMGRAVPPLCRRQHDIQETMAQLWGLSGAALQRWRRIIAGTEIETRHGVLPLEQVVHMTTAQRMGVYARFAPDLAARAAAAALDRCRISAAQITDLIVVSCTGFSAPGVDVALVGALGLRPTVRRIMIGFMGCFGGITGLRAAVGACAADPTAIALVVCVELCSLHMRADQDAQNHVASALFADGAAAAVVASNKVRGGDNRQFQPGGIGRLTIGASRLIEQGQDWMTWRITDNGFAMTLTRAVPVALRECLADFVCGACRDRPNSFILHPGGPGILDAADEALQLAGGCGLEASRAVLKRFGNMSSATILFALDEAMRHGFVLPALLLAFGPGLTIESMAVLPNLQSEH